MKRHLLAIIIVLVLPRLSVAQGMREMKDHPGALYEIGIGVSYYHSSYQISGLETTLIRSELYDQSLYNTQNNERDFRSVMVQIPIQLHRFAYVKPLFSYEWVKESPNGDFSYSDVTDLEYNISLNYRYFRLGAEIGFSVPLFSENNEDGFIHNGLSIQLGVGYSAGICIGPDNIEYNSNDELTGPDEQIQADLQTVLEGRSIANGHLKGAICYKGFFINFMQYFDNADVLLTKRNEYSFIENDNKRSNSLMIGIGISIPIFSFQDYSNKQYSVGDKLAPSHPFHRKF